MGILLFQQSTLRDHNDVYYVFEFLHGPVIILSSDAPNGVVANPP